MTAGTVAARRDLGFEHVIALGMIATGAGDPYVEPGKPQRLAELLRAAGAQVDHRIAATGHQLGAADIAGAQAWLAERSAEQSR
jgi:predicted esterase